MFRRKLHATVQELVQVVHGRIGVCRRRFGATQVALRIKLIDELLSLGEDHERLTGGICEVVWSRGGYWRARRRGSVNADARRDFRAAVKGPDREENRAVAAISARNQAASRSRTGRTEEEFS